MNKSELITVIAEKTVFTKKDTEKLLGGIIETIQEKLAAGEKVQISGLGIFEVKDRKERLGRNPRNPSETIKVPASKGVIFRASKPLKDSVNL